MHKIFRKVFKLNKTYFNIMLILLFLFLSLIAIYPFWHSGYLYSGLDMQFHLSRIEEWSQDIAENGLFSHPIIATHSFNQIGDIVPSMYPDVTLYPFALFMLIMKPLNAIYVGFTLIVFVTLILSYYSMFIIVRSKQLAFYFAILYGFTTYIIDQVLNFETGTALAYQFLPVAFAGLYMIMHGNYKKWYWFTLGLTGIMYSHTLSSLLYILMFILIYVIYFYLQKHGERWIRFKYLLISLVITFFLCISTWYLLIRTMLSQKLNTPNSINLNGGSGPVFGILTMPFQNNGFNDGLGLFIVVIAFVGFIFLRKVPRSIQKYYYFGLINIFILSNLFPWGFVSQTPIINNLNIIQKTSRLFPISILLLSVYGSYVLYILFNNKEKLVISGIILLLINIFTVYNFNYSGLYSNNARPYVNEKTLPYKATYTHQVPLVSVGGYKINNHTFYNQFPEENETGMEDYIPKNSANNFGDIAMKGSILHGKHFNIDPHDIQSNVNGIDYHLAIPMIKGTVLTLPFLKYNGLIYNIKFNGKHVFPHKTKYDTLKIYIPTHVSSMANISIKCIQPYSKSLIYITLIAWIFILIYILQCHSSNRYYRKIYSKIYNYIMFIRKRL